ncbi:unnamed protein product [Orchesella dallaii]|uniref:Calponin-homology (CH) domain-containing protein n=1 Tax=Orchesella dallaii TaxID=48710 RepID=A0ABP1RWK1_9HEXA
MDPPKKASGLGSKPKPLIGKALSSKKSIPESDNKGSIVPERRKTVGTGTVKKAPSTTVGISRLLKTSKQPEAAALPSHVEGEILDASVAMSDMSLSDTPGNDVKPSSSLAPSGNTGQPQKPKFIKPYPTVAALKKNDPKNTKLNDQLNELAEKTLRKSVVQKGPTRRPTIPPPPPLPKRNVHPTDHRSSRQAQTVKDSSKPVGLAPTVRPPTRRVVKQPSSPPSSVARGVSTNDVTSPAKRSTSNGSTSGVSKRKDVGSGTKAVPVVGEPSTPRKCDESFSIKVFTKKQSKSPKSESLNPCKHCGHKTEDDGIYDEQEKDEKAKGTEGELEQASNRILDLEIKVKDLEDQLASRDEEQSGLKEEVDMLQANLELAMKRIADLEQEKDVLVQQMQSQKEIYHREIDQTVQDCAMAVKSVDSFWDESKKECDELKKKNSELQLQLEVLLQPRPISTPSHPQTPTDCTGETLRDFTNTVNDSSAPGSGRVAIESSSEHEDLPAAQSENMPVPSAQIIEKSHAPRSLDVDKENRSEQKDRETNANKKIICTTVKENQKLAMLRKTSGGSIRNGLLAWCQSCVEGYRHVSVTNFSTSFADGLALCALIHSLSPTLIDMNELSPSTPMKNYETAVAAASMMGVGVELDIKAIVCSENPPWETIMSYIIEIYNVHTAE